MSLIVDAIGTIGALMFAASCIPLAWKTCRAGKSLGTPRQTVWMFCGATVIFTLYLALKVGLLQGSTLISGSEAVAWLIVLFYEYFPNDLFIPIEMYKVADDIVSVNRMWRDGDQIPIAWGKPHPTYAVWGDCVRPHHEEGPCNGYPRRDCPMTDEVRKHFYPD